MGILLCIYMYIKISYSRINVTSFLNLEILSRFSMASQTGFIPNQKFVSAIHPFTVVLKMYGIDIKMESSLNDKCNLKRCGITLHSIILFCVVLFLTTVFLTIVDFLALNDAGKCLSAVTVTTSVSTLSSIVIFRFRRGHLNELVQSICRLSYLVEKYQPKRFKILKVLSYMFTLGPYICVMLFAVSISLYANLSELDNFWATYFATLMNQSLVVCYDHINLINEAALCEQVVPSIGIIFLVIWCTIIFACLIHCIGLIITFNLMLSCSLRCSRQTYLEAQSSDGQVEVTVKRQKVNKFIILHKELSSVIQTADTTFGEMNFVISAVEIFNVIMSLRCMDITSLEIYKILLLLPITLVLVVTFVARTLCSGQVNYQVISRIILKALLSQVYL